MLPYNTEHNRSGIEQSSTRMSHTRAGLAPGSDLPNPAVQG